MELRRTASTQAKRVVKRALRPLAARLRVVIDRVDSHLAEASITDTRRRIDRLTVQIDELARMLRDPNPPIEAVQHLERGLTHMREMVLGIGERVHSQQVMLDELQFRFERLAGSVLDGMAVERRLQNIEDRVVASRD